MNMSPTPHQSKSIKQPAAATSPPGSPIAEDLTSLAVPSLRQTLLDPEPSNVALQTATPELDKRSSDTATTLARYANKLSDIGATTMAGGISISGVLLYLYWSSSTNPAQIIREAANSEVASRENFSTLGMIALVGAVPLVIGGAISLAGEGLRKVGSWLK